MSGGISLVSAGPVSSSDSSSSSTWGLLAWSCWKILIAWATKDDGLPPSLGSRTVVPFLATCEKALTYCSATLRFAALVLPLVVIASETSLIPRAEASDKARTAPASPSDSRIWACFFPFCFKNLGTLSSFCFNLHLHGHLNTVWRRYVPDFITETLQAPICCCLIDSPHNILI